MNSQKEIYEWLAKYDAAVAEGKARGEARGKAIGEARGLAKGERERQRLSDENETLRAEIERLKAALV